MDTVVSTATADVETAGYKATVDEETARSTATACVWK